MITWASITIKPMRSCLLLRVIHTDLLLIPKAQNPGDYMDSGKYELLVILVSCPFVFPIY
jgi:hypothetical protein